MAFKMKNPFKQAIAESTYVKPPKEVKEKKCYITNPKTGEKQEIPCRKENQEGQVGGSGKLVSERALNLAKMKKYHGRGRKFFGIHG